MKKIGLLFKEVSESRIKNSLKDSESLFIIRYAGLSSPDLSSLRQSLRAANTSLFVAKNSVARRALKGSGWEALVKLIDGPCGLIFIKEEPVGVSKLLCNFLKTHETLKLEGGFLKDKILEGQDIQALSRLPSREVLLTQLVVAINSPISGLVITLKQIISNFVYCLDQIKDKKGTAS